MFMGSTAQAGIVDQRSSQSQDFIEISFYTTT